MVSTRCPRRMRRMPYLPFTLTCEDLLITTEQSHLTKGRKNADGTDERQAENDATRGDVPRMVRTKTSSRNRGHEFRRTLRALGRCGVDLSRQQEGVSIAQRRQTQTCPGLHRGDRFPSGARA